MPELFTLLPAECIAGTRLGFYIELLTTLLTPVFLFLFTIIVVSLARCLSFCLSNTSRDGDYADDGEANVGRKHGVARHDGILTHPRVQTVTIFLLLVVYPMICRKIFSVFDCVEAGLDRSTSSALYFLREDPVERCFTFTHNLWSIAAGVGVLLYCIGVPFMFFVSAARFFTQVSTSGSESTPCCSLLTSVFEARFWQFEGVSEDDPERRRAAEGVILLVDAYKDKMSYPEAVSMLHKCFFTGVIHIILPGKNAHFGKGPLCYPLALTS